VKAVCLAFAVLLVSFAAGCTTNADWVGAHPDTVAGIPWEQDVPDCYGQNGPHWLRLDSPPADAQTYLRLTNVGSSRPQRDEYDDVWYTRKPGEFLLCRTAREDNVVDYSAAFWRFRVKDGAAKVMASYKWTFVVVN
jgi:hypothetical protein